MSRTNQISEIIQLHMAILKNEVKNLLLYDYKKEYLCLEDYVEDFYISYEGLMEWYISTEEYEICAELLEQKRKIEKDEIYFP